MGHGGRAREETNVKKVGFSDTNYEGNIRQTENEKDTNSHKK